MVVRGSKLAGRLPTSVPAVSLRGTAVCTTAGSAAGTIAVAGVGSAVGALAGGGLSLYLNRRLKPRMLEVATRIAGVDEDDLFYLRNKAAIDGIGSSLAETKAA